MLLLGGLTWSIASTETTTAAYSGVTSPPGSTLAARGCYPKVPDSDPVFFYSYNEPSGTTVEDNSGNGNDGTLRGTVTRTTAACTTARDGNYATFDGRWKDPASGEASLIPSHVRATDPNTFTIETWFRFPSAATRGGCLISFGESEDWAWGNAHDRMLYLSDAGKLIFGVYPGTYPSTTQVVSSGSTTYRDDTWHLAEAMLSSTGQELWVDGQRVGYDSTVTTGYDWGYDGYWRIGQERLWQWPDEPTAAAPHDAYPFTGDLDNTAVYYSRLDPAIIDAHWDAGYGRGLGPRGSVPLTVGTSVGLETYNYPGERWAYTNPGLVEYPINASSSATDRNESSFMVRAGRASSNGISFESVAHPGYYMAAPASGAPGDLTLLQDDGTAVMKTRLTYLPVAGNAGSYTSFQTLGNSGLYLRHQNGTIKATTISSALDQEDSTWIVRRGLG